MATLQDCADWCLLWIEMDISQYAILLALSIITFGVLSPLTISFGLASIYWYCAYQSFETQIALLRGFVISAVLTIVTDAMSVGSWLALRLWLQLPAVAIMLCCSILLFAAIIVASLSLSESAGIFLYVFRWTVLEPSQQILHSWNVQVSESRNVREHVFQGRGHRLGGNQDTDVEMGFSANLSSLLRMGGER